MKTQGVSMRGIFWNIRDLNHLGRNGQLIRTHRVYFIRVQEIKKEDFHPSFFDKSYNAINFSMEFHPC